MPTSAHRIPKVCHHKRANHQHGTRPCYVHDKCRCYPCAAANSDYAAALARQKLYGRYEGLVDSEPARQHVRGLMAAGMGWKQVARVAGLSPGVISALLYGKNDRAPSKRIRKDTADQLLAARLDLAAHAHIDSTVYVRRLRALIALGWSQASLAARLGITPSNFTPVIDGSRKALLATTSKAIRALYDELSMKCPPETTRCERTSASRARNMAKARGWVPPLAWDEGELDDPAAVPVKTSGAA